MPDPDDLLKNFYNRLLSGDQDEFLEIFAENSYLADPQSGVLQGMGAIADYYSEMSAWLKQERARPMLIHSIETPRRVVAEWELHLDEDDEEYILPVAAVGDIEGERLGAVRIYHSQWPLQKAHVYRPPLLSGPPSTPIPDVVGRYQSALAQGSLEAVLAQFEPDGYVREPSGDPYIYQGEEELREFYEDLFSDGGGIGLEHCTVTDDGESCAVEYNVVRWGMDPIEPQAGVAVYVRGPSGLLTAARIYDDVNPPIDL